MGAKDTVAPALHTPTLHSGNPEIHRDDDSGHQSDIDVGGIHQHQGQHGTGEERENIDEEILYSVAEAHDSPVNSRLQLAGFVAFLAEIRHAELQNAVHHTQREVAAHMDANLFSEETLSEGNQGRQYLFAKQHTAYH